MIHLANRLGGYLYQVSECGISLEKIVYTRKMSHLIYIYFITVSLHFFCKNRISSNKHGALSTAL